MSELRSDGQFSRADLHPKLAAAELRGNLGLQNINSGIDESFFKLVVDEFVNNIPENDQRKHFADAISTAAKNFNTVKRPRQDYQLSDRLFSKVWSHYAQNPKAEMRNREGYNILYEIIQQLTQFLAEKHSQTKKR